MGKLPNELQKYVSFIKDNLDAENPNEVLFSAIYVDYGYAPIIKDLINLSQVNACDKDGMTLLMWASAFGNLSAVKELIAHGAKIDLQNPEGDTASDFAKIEFPKIVELLNGQKE